jgi:hypothetical protein
MGGEYRKLLLLFLWQVVEKWRSYLTISLASDGTLKVVLKIFLFHGRVQWVGWLIVTLVNLCVP